MGPNPINFGGIECRLLTRVDKEYPTRGWITERYHLPLVVSEVAKRNAGPLGATLNTRQP